MNTPQFRQSPQSHRRGVTLVESVIAIGILAVAIPMVFGAIAESGKSGLSSQAETRSTWIVPACMDEIRASREGRPQYFTSTAAGETFPPAGEVWALAFSPAGKPIGRLDKSLYQAGARELDGTAIRYIATITASPETPQSASTSMLRVEISLEYPAALKAEKREKLVFHTRIP